MTSVSTGENNNNNEKESVVTTCSNYISNNNTFNNKNKKIVTSVYVFGQKVSLRIPVDLWNVFRQIAKVEGLSASKLAEKAMMEYCKNHPQPNPQLILPYYMPEVNEPTPLRVLCIYCNGALSNGEVYCQKVGGWVKSIKCYSCKNNRLRK